MKFVITGGAGFIGSHLAEYLISQSHSVEIIDNLHNANEESLKNLKDKIQFHKADILDFDILKKILKNSDGVFHHASLISVQESLQKPEEYYQVNVKGSENIFKLGLEFGFKIVFASSAAVYGNTSKLLIKEDSKKNSLNQYAETKIQAENIAQNYINSGAKIIGLRYFNVYGKGQSKEYAGVIMKFMERISNRQPPIIFGDGSQTRDFVSVEDVVKVNLKAMLSDVDSGFFNIGSSNAVSILELAKIMIKASGLSLEPVFSNSLEGEIKDSQADITLALKKLNWKPETKLENWINQAIHEISN